MKLINLIIILITTIVFLSCDTNVKMEKSSGGKAELIYDSVKAQEYGADPYGMKKYVMAFLKKGPNKDLDKDSAMKLEMAHLKNIEKMAKDGKLVLAGPFFGNQELRGIYIFNVESIIEAEELTGSDPAIQAGSLEMELLEWYGSAALIEVNKIHKTLAN